MKSVLLLIFSINLLANCGYGDTFEELFCAYKEGYETTLTNVSYSSGSYTCRYANTADTILEKKKIACIDKFKNIAENISSLEQDSFNSSIDSNIHVFADTIYTNESTLSDHFIGSTDFTQKFNTKKLFDLNKEIKIQKTSKNFRKINFPEIDSHTESEKTLGAIILGAFTMDSEYFIDGFVNELGELELKNEYKMTGLGSTHSDIGDGGLIDTIKGWLGPDVAGDIEQIDALSFMDRQVLGYLVSLSIAFKESAVEIIYLVLSLGMLWSFGYYGFRKAAAVASKKDDFNINTTSWLLGAGFALTFFLAPIYDDGTLNENRSSKVQNVQQHNENWTTPAQAALRYFVQAGNYFGNIISDKSMNAYLNLLTDKQGMLNDIHQFSANKNEVIKDINKQKLALGADTNFYNQVCRSYFNTDGSLIKSRQISKNMTMFTSNQILWDKFSIGSNRLDYDTCAKLENDIQNNTNSVVKKVDTLANDLNNMSALFNSDSDARKNFQRFINTMAYTQNQFGWIASPAVPISYFFFKNADFFAYNEKILEEREPTNIFKNTVQNFRQNDESRGAVQKVSEKVGDIFSGSSNILFSTAFWFIVPGFESIFHFIEKPLQESYDNSIHHLNAIKEQHSDDDSGLLKKMVNKAANLFGNIPGIPGIMAKITEFATSDTKSPTIKVLITVASLLITVVLFQIAIGAITLTAIAAFLTIKITLYLLEVLIYFLVIPILGVYYVIMGESSQKRHVSNYFQKLGILSITPVLMTITTYLIIAFAEVLEHFFKGLIKLFIYLANDGAKDLYSSSGVYFSNIAKKTMALGMINGLATIFIYFAVLVIATIMIYNFRDWFVKMAGITMETDIMKEGGNEIRQGLTRYINPVS